MMRKKFLLLFASLACASLMAQDVPDLQWSLHHGSKEDPEDIKVVEAAVPGAVQLDVGRAEGYGPYYYAENWKDYLWMEDREFEYVTQFIKPRLENGQRLIFHCLGIDYAFQIRLNGKVLHEQEGMFTPVRLDLTASLQVQNELRIKIYPIPKKHTRSRDRSQAAASFKPAVSYGWDWHPRLVPSGIWDDAWLEILPASHVEELSIQYSLSEDLDKAYIRVEAEGRELDGCRMEWKLRDSLGNLAEIGFLTPYRNRGVLYSELSRPELWWPHDHGDPYLYSYTLALTDAYGNLLQTLEGRMGFRRVRLVMNEGGWSEPEGFPKTRSVVPIQLEINGKNIFCKGTNWVNPEIFPGIIGPKRYAELIDRALEANFNMLRVWGGGIVNKESFHDLCDQKGILVWQEFPLACNNYEDDPEFLALVEREAASIVGRIRRHPSLALWSGGNELFNAWSGMSDQSRVLRTLNKLCLDLDPLTPFISTSPLFGMAHGHYVFRDPSSGEEVYSLMNRAHHTAYTEFGVPSPSRAEILEAIIPADELWPPREGGSWESHHAFNAWVGDTWLMPEMIESYFGKSDQLETLVERGQMLQSEGYKAIYEEARRQKPYCSMALNWCFNEPWPTAANNSIINWPNWPKPAFYAVKNACRPVLASARNKKLVWSRGEVFSAQVWMLNDLHEVLAGGKVRAILLSGNKHLELGSWDFTGAAPNTNAEGPWLKAELPGWKATGFTLLLEVEGHPEYNSSYDFLLTD